MKLISTNPGNNYEINGEVEISTVDEIKTKVELANNAKKEWKKIGISKRIEYIKSLVSEFEKRKEEITILITKEMGKPVSQARGEVTGSFDDINGFYKWSQVALKDEITHEDESAKHRIIYEPWGTAAVITPWNYPFEMFVWGAFPNLLAGNTVVFKISEECPLMGKLIEEVVSNSNLPKGVFNVVHGDGEVGKILVNQDIDLIWFTGSTKAGEYLYETAGKKFIKAVLEMGGSNPGVIFEDVDTKSIAENLYNKRFSNCGQVCMALKRLIVHESIFDKIVEELKSIVETKKRGNPINTDVEIGSLAAKRQLDLLKDQVKDAVDKGAKIVIGGHEPDDLEGAYYMPTILTDITKDMKVWNDEVFGPVLSVISFKTESEAVELANDTIYGLGAIVYSKDKERALRAASQIDAGTVEINGANRWKECNPFGGYKKSGMGREHGIIGFRELCQVKVISESK
ncbi:aldehyde dehydrogenase family protein [archaeon]|jgi:succinate-semialdehyde dehydrogenase / glutarate-semialdehyde dehydrogenase|nr:aldehyde dehydrogenase family protein [archaeon]MBT4351250.1 aldehyde dehydrogenase family protein [archaeon]MBT4648136.1 aldehyde dehydrogenase family protein [archaeon]MBT6822446.1 aldehyde dehydrogenase family protein [archaeon]MBT7392104.1 aldehyde dehydrogenase family protein [archaeon]